MQPYVKIAGSIGGHIRRNFEREMLAGCGLELV
jgi:hypothetical protein